jgi:dolichol-phosphate mannosyltransferase
MGEGPGVRAISILHSAIRNRHFRTRFIQFTKFCLVGGSGVFVDMGILYLLADPNRLGWNITLSKICAAEIAMINNFIWNELWTFRSLSPSTDVPRSRERERVAEGRVRDVGEEHSDVERAGVRSRAAIHQSQIVNRQSKIAGRFILFNAICGIGIGLAVLLLHLFHSWLGWNVYLSNLLAILLVTCLNFGMNARFNWAASTFTERTVATA